MQYGRFLGDMLTGNFGVSMASGRTVLQEVALVLPWTLQLTAAAILIGVAFGLPLGIWAALRRNAWPDYLGRLLSLTGLSFPAFVSAILMLLVFAIQLRWFPVIGSGGGSDWGSQLRNLVLPAFTLAFVYLAQYSRLARASVMDALAADYIRTARAKGLPERIVLYRHALRNGVLPVVTMLGLQFGNVLAGAILVETVFNWPGLGRLAFDSVLRRDYPTLLGILLFASLLVVVMNQLTDLAYRLIDPRIKAS